MVGKLLSSYFFDYELFIGKGMLDEKDRVLTFAQEGKGVKEGKIKQGHVFKFYFLVLFVIGISFVRACILNWKF